MHAGVEEAENKDIIDENERQGDKSKEVKSVLKYAKEQLSKAFSRKGVIGLIKDNRISMKNIIVGVLSYGLEQLTSSEVFDCPVKQHKLYGNCFLYFPAMLLFCGNLLVVGEIWKLSGRCFIVRYRRRGDVVARLIPFGIVRALVGPAAWLIACFANGKYYLCATVGPGVHKMNLTDPGDVQALEDELATMRSQSHILAWLVLGLITSLGTMVLITKNCFFKDHLLLDNLYMYERREATAAMWTFEKIMRGEDIDSETEEEKNKKTYNFGDHDEFDFYIVGVPETTGKETVRKIFEDENFQYVQAYEKFCQTYPRIATGNPANTWCRTVRPGGDAAVCDGRPQPSCSRWCCPVFDCQRRNSEELGSIELEHLVTKTDKCPKLESPSTMNICALQHIVIYATILEFFFLKFIT